MQCQQRRGICTLTLLLFTLCQSVLVQMVAVRNMHFCFVLFLVLYACMHACLHIRHTHTHAHAHAHTRTRMHAHTHTRMHTRTHSNTNTHSNTSTNTNTQTHWSSVIVINHRPAQYHQNHFRFNYKAHDATVFSQCECSTCGSEGSPMCSWKLAFVCFMSL